MKNLCVLVLSLFLSFFSNAQTEISGIINDYAAVLETDHSECFNQVTVNDASAFSVGDQVLLMQMKDAQIDESNSSDFGNINDIGNTGLYEINEITAIDGNIIFLKYQNLQELTGTNSGALQIIRMPVYDNAEIVGTLTANAWDGSTGGVLALQVDGQLFMDADIDVNGLGYRGGIATTANSNNCTWVIQQSDYFYNASNWRGSAKGEGVANFINGKEHGKGAQANGGGGGNDHNSGGGGGANVTNGGAGGENDEPSTFGCKGFQPGVGGKAISETEGRLFLGGGGGAGHENNENATDGANGGGIVILIVNEFYPLGYRIKAEGDSPADGGGDGAGGGGAGGTIVLIAQSVESTVHLEANGGDGGLIDNGNAERCHGPGGGGSGGRILINQVSGSPIDVGIAGGDAGMSINSSSCGDGTNEAQAGSSGVLEELISVAYANESFEFPIADFDFNTNGGLVDFINQSTNGETYEWDFGDASGDNISNPDHTYSMSGIYEVELIVSNSCGSDTIVQEVMINIDLAPSAFFTFEEESGCSPLLVNFTDGSLGTVENYQWTFTGGNPASSTLQNPVVTYNTPGIYDVQLEVDGPGGSDILLIENAIEVFAEAVADFDFNVNGGMVSFINQSSNENTYEWDFGDGAGDNISDPNHTYMMSGVYEVQLIVSNACGADTISQEVLVDDMDALTAQFTLDDGSACAPWLVNFSDESIGTVEEYLWTFEGGNPMTSTEPNPQVLYENPGTFDVSLEITGPQGSDLILIEDQIDIAPSVVIDFDFDVNGSEVSFTNATLNANSYQWDFGDGSPVSTEENPVHLYSDPGTYEVTLSATSVYCGALISKIVFLDFVDIEEIGEINLVKIFPNPVADILSIQTEIKEEIHLKVYSIDGKEVTEYQQSFLKNLEIHTENLQPGVYIIRLEYGDYKNQYKLVKIKP